MNIEQPEYWIKDEPADDYHDNTNEQYENINNSTFIEEMQHIKSEELNAAHEEEISGPRLSSEVKYRKYLSGETAVLKPEPCLSRPLVIFNKKAELYKEYIRFACPQCNQTLDNVGLLRAHIEEHHNGSSGTKALTFNKQNICLVCKTMAPSSNYLRLLQHAFTHMQHFLFNCIICKEFGVHKPQAMIKHLEDKHLKVSQGNKRKKDDEKQPQNKHCKIETEKDNSAKLDVYKQAMEFTCPKCGNVFETHQQWQQHIKVAHNFDKMEYLNVTLRRNAETGKKEWTCNECGMESKSYVLQSMRLHAFTHLPFRMTRCKVCNKIFSQLNEIRIHIETQHIDAKTGELILHNPDTQLEG